MVVCGRGGLAVVDGDRSVEVGAINEHETAAAEVACARKRDGQRESDSDRRIDGVAPALDVQPNREAAASWLTIMPCLATIGRAVARGEMRAASSANTGAGNEQDEREREKANTIQRQISVSQPS